MMMIRDIKNTAGPDDDRLFLIMPKQIFQKAGLRSALNFVFDPHFCHSDRRLGRMKIGKLAQTDIALCRLRVTYILCKSRLADKGDNQSDMQPDWECVSHCGSNCNF